MNCTSVDHIIVNEIIITIYLVVIEKLVIIVPIDRSIVRSCLTRIGTACRVIMRITLYSIACLFMLRRRRRRHLFVMIFTRLFTPLVALLFTLGFTLGFPLDAKLAYLLQLSGRYLPKILLLIGSRFFLEPFPFSTVTASAKSFVTTMRDYHRLFIVTPYCRASVTGIREGKKSFDSTTIRN